MKRMQVKRIFALLIAVTLSSPAFAQEPMGTDGGVNVPIDAPLVATGEQSSPVVPDDSVLSFTPQERANILKAYTYQKARADKLEAEVPPTKAVVIGLIVGAFLVGGAIGVGATVAVNSLQK